MNFMAILEQKMHHFWFYFPEALFDKLKHVKITIISLSEATWFLFEVNICLYSKVMIVLF